MPKNGNKNKGNIYHGMIFVTRRGKGYVETSDYEQDIEISHENLNTALHGDRVEVRLLPLAHDTRPYGEISKVLDRAKEQFVGTIENERGVCFFTADDTHMYTNIVIPEEEVRDIKSGTKVVVKLTTWEDPKRNPEGKIIEVLGAQGTNDVEMRAIVIEHGFSTLFPEAVEQAASTLSGVIPSEEIEKRKDMRGIATFTIDPSSAKDFDDALSISVLENGNISVGVHIADVTHYIHPNDTIDTEAQKRGTSIYLVDRTVPMLPEILSNEICSLKPNEDRLAYSAIFTFTKDYTLEEEWYGETVIHSNKRFTYENAQNILDAKSGAFKTELTILWGISKKLRDARLKEGAIDFDQDEVEFELDKNGKPLRIYKKKRLDTNKLIEEFMLLANRKVAKYFYNLCKKIGGNNTFIYRVHDMPDPDKIEELKIFLRAIGYKFEAKDGIVTAGDINTLFGEVEGKPEENLVKTSTIRSMAKAIYSTQNIGHFGLAFKYYTHFTSPIRRYPDILVHRILKNQAKKKKDLGYSEFRTYERLALHASRKEVEAVQAERDSIKYKQVEYMQEHIGKTFTGYISGVTEWGLYIEESETKAEGLVHISTIGNDFFTLDKKNFALVGRSTKHKYTLGDEVAVKLTRADLEAKTLDFVFV